MEEMPAPTRAPGRTGRLDLRLGIDSATRRTTLQHYAHQTPLQVGRLLYPDEACPDMAYVYVAMITGGLVQGDRLEHCVDVTAGARAHVTTLSATKVYRTTDGQAEQSIALRVEEGGVLEWWPDPIIPFRHARFAQTVELTAHPGGVMLYGDLLLPGRTGERHEYAAYTSRLTARSAAGTLLFADSQSLAPPPFGRRRLREILPPERQVIGSVYVLACDAGGALVDAIRDTLHALEVRLPLLASPVPRSCLGSVGWWCDSSPVMEQRDAPRWRPCANWSATSYWASRHLPCVRAEPAGLVAQACLAPERHGESWAVRPLFALCRPPTMVPVTGPL
jgi:urease accessory protein